jgi:hypothetical protein
MWKESSEIRGDLFIDVTAPDPRIVIFGAVEYAQHLSALAPCAAGGPTSSTRAPALPPRSASPTRSASWRPGRGGVRAARRGRRVRRRPGAHQRPVGLDLGATNARETALSIMAELAAVRHGREGGRLCHSKGEGRVHSDAQAKA